MGISIVINTYNAAEHLSKTLDSVKDIEDKVVCDMYSSDSTVEIAKSYGCNVVYHENCGICEPARNFAISQAKNSWVLVLDADEVAPEALLTYCKEIALSNNDTKGVFIPRKNFFHGVFMHASYPDYILRLVNKESCFWPSQIHSTPQINGKVIKIPAHNSDMAIIHLDDQNISQRVAKMNQYTNKEMVRIGDSGRKFGRLSIIYRPLFYFIKFYLIKGGFKDGKMGLVYSLLHSYYRFLIIAKSWERKIS